jgi:putative inorganic carbon (HCO3(-)) transporter
MNYLIEHCILAVAFFLPLSLKVTSVFLAAGTMLWLGKMLVARRLGFRGTPFDLAVALLVICSAASVMVSPDRGFSYYNYYHLMGRYILIYYLVINNIQSLEQVKRLMTAMLFSAGVVAAYGFYQYIHGIDISAFEWVDGEQFPHLKTRVFSTLENPNLLAGFLVTIMAIASGLGLVAGSVKGRLPLFGLVLALGVCLVFTYSRGAWVSVLAVIIIYGVLHSRRILWLLAVVPVLLVAGHELILERLMSILNPTDTSSTLRLALWESTIAMIMDKPLLGIGWGAYWLVYPQYDFFVLDAGTKIFHAHNMYLHIAAEIGLPGFLAFMAIMGGHAYIAYRIAAIARQRWAAGLMLGIFTALVGLAVSGFTDYIMFNVQLSMLFWLLNALIIVVYLNNYRCE